jgi:hypothetical protein
MAIHYEGNYRRDLIESQATLANHILDSRHDMRTIYKYTYNRWSGMNRGREGREREREELKASYR